MKATYQEIKLKIINGLYFVVKFLFGDPTK